MIASVFKDRKEAGRELAGLFDRWAGERKPVVLGLPRGGVPVAFEIAKRLRAQLDVFMVGKIGFPDQPELALGAVTASGARVLNADLIAQTGLSQDDIEGIARKKRQELERKEALYRQGGPPSHIEDQVAILVDDGAATGASMCAALGALRLLNPRHIIAALPVASKEALAAIRREADETICVKTPQAFRSVGEWYSDFRQVQDEDVLQSLDAAKAWHWSPIPERTIIREFRAEGPVPVKIDCGDVRLAADLTVPRNACGLVLFAHGTGSGRHSPRNRMVARTLNEADFATLLLDLLTEDEAWQEKDTGAFRFDLDLLANRLVCATRKMLTDPRTSSLPLGYFGASTGAAAAIQAAAGLTEMISAVVSRGGRPDLAAGSLPRLDVPILFIVGGNDTTVLDLTRKAMGVVHAEKRLEIIPGATHLFEEPGALEEVTRLAVGWFETHLAQQAVAGS